MAAVTAEVEVRPDDLDLVIVGGCGHVGLPLALSFADAGDTVGVYDIDRRKVGRVRSGQMPFMESGAEDLLRRLLPTGRLEFASDPSILERSSTVIVVIGTPIDEFMNPSTRVFEQVVDEFGPHLRPGALVVLRSTVYPGTTEYVADRLAEMGLDASVAFCPERIAEGQALQEIRSLPQLVGADTDLAFHRAVKVFKPLGVEIIRCLTKEAEMAKLFTNTWRYMKFAIANQFFQMSQSAGIDHERVLHAIRHNYPRAKDLPGPGFAAGPCLLKDTMQLAAFSTDNFPLGHSAMLINEGLPAYVVDMLGRRGLLRDHVVGILGMAFKGDSDDPRSSLSYKLKKLLTFHRARVLTTDPHVPDPDLLPLAQVIDQSDVLVVGAPHRQYRGLDVKGKSVVDLWGVVGDRITV